VVKRSDILLVITIVAFLFPVMLNGQVQVTDTSTVKLDEVTITGRRIPVRSNQMSKFALVIPASLIAHSPQREIADLLRSSPVLDIRSRGPFSVQSDVSIRGGSFEQSAVLLNGINLNDPQTGHFLLDLPVPVHMLKQVEVLPGSDARSMGAGALAGAVNLVTSKPDNNEFRTEISAGRWGLRNIEASSRFGRKPFWHQEGIQYQGSDGYRDNTDFKKYGAFFQAGFGKGSLKADLTTGLQLKSFGANSFYSAKYPNQFEETASGLSVLNLTWTGKIHVNQSLFYKTHYDVFHLFRSDPPSWYLNPNYHISQVAGSKTDLWFKSVIGITSMGAEIRNESIRSTVLGTISDQPVRWPFSDSIMLSRRAVRTHYSIVVQQDVELRKLAISGSLVFQMTRGNVTYFNIYPGIEAGFPITSGIRMYGSFNRGFRLPSFTELYYQSPTNTGNPNLLPESAWHSEAGFKFRKALLEANLAGFYRYAGQSIDWVRLASEQVWHAENLGKMITYGLDGMLRYRNTAGYDRKFAMELAQLGLKYCFLKHSADPYYSLYILDYLKWKASASLILRYGSHWKLTLQGIAQDRAGTYTLASADGSVQEKEFEPFFLLDARLSYMHKAVMIFADCSNLLDQPYVDFGNIPQPGLWYRMGISVEVAWQ
jgi:iron complex outermembrane receptor protein